MARKSTVLNDTQKAFCLEYVKDFNAARAARDAGYSTKTARAIATRLLKHPPVEAEIARLTASKLTRIEDEGITADRILLEFSRVCRADLRRVTGPDGAILPIQQWPDDMAAAIASVEVSEDRFGKQTVKIKLWDKVAALTSMAKHFGLLKDLTEHSGHVTYGWLGDGDTEPVVE